MRALIFVLIYFSFAFAASAAKEVNLPIIFGKIEWAISEAEILDKFKNYKIQISEENSDYITGEGIFVKQGKLKTITIKDYKFDSYFVSNVTFAFNNEYYGIFIESQELWSDCDGESCLVDGVIKNQVFNAISDSFSRNYGDGECMDEGVRRGYTCLWYVEDELNLMLKIEPKENGASIDISLYPLF